MKKIYESIGRCIYCLRTADRIRAEDHIPQDKDPLSREHIIPFGLSGILEFERASCTVCQRIINDEFENWVLNHQFIHARALFKLKSRTKKLPKFLRAYLNRPDALRVPVEVPVEDYPAGMVVPQLNPPAILTGLPLPTGGDFVTGGIYFHWSKDFLKKFEGIEIRHPLRIDRFARFLAKVAHGYLVGEKGMEGKDLLLPSIILGREPPTALYVGGSFVVETAADEYPPHRLQIRTEGDLLVVTIQFLSVLGKSPCYDVVAARLHQ